MKCAFRALSTRFRPPPLYILKKDQKYSCHKNKVTCLIEVRFIGIFYWNFEFWSENDCFLFHVLSNLPFLLTGPFNPLSLCHGVVPLCFRKSAILGNVTFSVEGSHKTPVAYWIPVNLKRLDITWRLSIFALLPISLSPPFLLPIFCTALLVNTEMYEGRK